jgi:hypothetical protein
VGKIQVAPGAYNVIPGKVVFGLELRDLDKEKILSMFEKIQAEAKQIARKSGTSISFTEPVVSTPALTDPRFQKLIDETARELGFSTKLMPSGAGHDAQEIAVIGPVGMIFVPSVGGISHSPREFSKPEDIANGANVLLHAVLKFDTASFQNRMQLGKLLPKREANSFSLCGAHPRELESMAPSLAISHPSMQHHRFWFIAQGNFQHYSAALRSQLGLHGGAYTALAEIVSVPLNHSRASGMTNLYDNRQLNVVSGK